MNRVSAGIIRNPRRQGLLTPGSPRSDPARVFLIRRQPDQGGHPGRGGGRVARLAFDQDQRRDEQIECLASVPPLAGHLLVGRSGQVTTRPRGQVASTSAGQATAAQARTRRGARSGGAMPASLGQLSIFRMTIFSLLFSLPPSECTIFSILYY